MSYISQPTNNNPWNHAFPDINGTNFCILVIIIKEPITFPQFLESISSQKLTEKYNKVHVITACIDKNIFRTNIQENRSIFNQIIHIQAIENKLISIP